MLDTEPQHYISPTLNSVLDGQPRVPEQVHDYVAEVFHTSKEDRLKYKGAARYPIFENNVAFALGYLNGRYGTFFITLDEKTGAYQITERGLALRKKFPKEISIKDLMEF